MKKPICSPYSIKNNSDDLNDLTCFTYENLKRIQSYWNDRHPDSTITTDDPTELWETLNFYMKKVLCNNEMCWVRKVVTDLNISNDIFAESFVPKMPKSWVSNPREWLSDLDISKVMKQYEIAHDDFIFLGPSPIDYNVCNKMRNDWVWPELKHFSLQKYIELQPIGKTKIGIVFNLDNHTGEGTHWVALFINIVEERIYYFDSNGNTIPANIKRLTDVIKEQGKMYNKKFTLSMNYPKVHQNKNTECGMYVIFFIITMLTSNKWSIFKNEKIHDDEIFKYRKVFFNDM